MHEINNLENFEKEYYLESSEKKVTIDDLKKYGVTDRTLAGEVYLISLFGNEIVEHKISDEIDENAEAEITTLDDYDIETNMAYNEIIKRIDESSFDENIDAAIGGKEI